MRGCPHAVKLEIAGKRSKANLENELGVSPVFSKTTMLVLILGKIRHDHKKYTHENPEISAAAKETYHRLMEAVK